jgi:hypothetical protein
VSFDLRDYILVFEDVVPADLCQQVLDEYKNDQNWMNTTTGNGLDRNVRRCDAINITEEVVIFKNENKRREIDQQLFFCAEKAIWAYNQKFPEAKIQQDSGYTLLRYQEEEFYSRHTDSFLQAPRAVSCSFSLNDDYAGGEWGFFDGQIKMKPPKGSAVMFPSNFMFPHEIFKVTRGVRYSIITWFI